MSCGSQFGQDAIQQIKLARHSIQKLITDLVGINDSLHLLKDKGMVTYLSQLHDCIIQALDASFSVNFVSIHTYNVLLDVMKRANYPLFELLPNSTPYFFI